MQTYLGSVFTVLFATSPDMARTAAVSPEVLARATTEQCFDDADANGDGKLSFAEFKQGDQSAGDTPGPVPPPRAPCATRRAWEEWARPARARAPPWCPPGRWSWALALPQTLSLSRFGCSDWISSRLGVAGSPGPDPEHRPGALPAAFFA